MNGPSLGVFTRGRGVHIFEGVQANTRSLESRVGNLSHWTLMVEDSDHARHGDLISEAQHDQSVAQLFPVPVTTDSNSEPFGIIAPQAKLFWNLI